MKPIIIHVIITFNRTRNTNIIQKLIYKMKSAHKEINKIKSINILINIINILINIIISNRNMLINKINSINKIINKTYMVDNKIPSTNMIIS